jgi:two-component system, chemotaxis family, sensor kinase CheA
MSSSVNMNEYIDLFLQETEEQLTVLESEIGNLQLDPTKQRIDQIFRAAHTIKGSSRAMGFGSFADLVHEFENILFKVRDGSLTVSDDVAEALILGVDSMLEAKDHISSTGTDYVPDASLVQTLASIASGTKVGSDYKSGVVADDGFVWGEEVLAPLREMPTLDGIYSVTLNLDESCAMKYVRSFMVITSLNSSGEIIAMYPTQEDLEAEKFETTVHFLYMSDGNPAAIQSTASNIGEVKSVDVKPLVLPIIAQTAAEVKNVSVEADSKPSESNTKPDEVPDKQAETKRDASQTIRVNVSLLDSLMNLVGELVIDRTRLSQIGANIAAKSESHEEIDALAETVGHIGRITSELQEQIMRARMLPIDTVFQRFPRTVRDLSRKLGKKISMVIEGGETEVDRSVIEGISDPLIHMIRNSVDHGMEMPEERLAAGKPEQGVVKLAAKHKDNAIWIEIIDDGRGIDPKRLRDKAVEKGIMSKEAAARLSDKDAQMLIFHSGFSTAKEVTDVSGRGVGMDIVRSNIQAMGGIIDLESTVGVGTRFILKLPLTVAIMGGLLSNVQSINYVMPISAVLETLAVESLNIKTVGKQPVIVLRGQTVPILKMRELFKVNDKFREESADNYVVVVGSAEQKVGLIVDRLLGEQEVVIKSISKYCGNLTGLSGATILGNGKVALIVDINSILESTRGFDHGY